ncbi:MAG: cyclic nucleotide-binding domain-containing protein [Acidobacteriota bacterium]
MSRWEEGHDGPSPEATQPAQGAPRGSSSMRVAGLGYPLARLDLSRLTRESLLGRGGMGAVHAVRDEQLHRQVAMKIMDRQYASDLPLVRRFLREIQITAQLEHPAIVPVYELGVGPDGLPCFTMQVVPGLTLSQKVKRLEETDQAGRLEMLDIMLRICDALAFAHARGVVHLDLKPQNVMVGDHGQVYVMDWGLARSCKTRARDAEPDVKPIVLDFSEEEAEVFGTPAYMPTELANGGEPDERTDVFGVGALIYHAFSGRPPFRGIDLDQTFAFARRCEYPPLDEVAPVGSVPPGLRRLVDKALSAEPEQRHQTMAELRTELQTLTRGSFGATRRRVKAGEEVVREGELGDEAYVIVAGALEARREEDGRPKALRTMGPGEVFGEMAILNATPRTATVVALEDSLLVCLSREEIEAELDGMTPWVARMLRTLAQRMQSVEDAG